MKKLITLFITTALCFSLIGCQNDKASKQTTSIETTTSDITPGIKKYGDEVVAKYNDFINGNISKDELSDQIYNLYDKMSDIQSSSSGDTNISLFSIELYLELSKSEYDRTDYERTVADLKTVLAGDTPSSVRYTGKNCVIGNTNYYLPNDYEETSNGEDSTFYHSYSDDSSISVTVSSMKQNANRKAAWKGIVKGFNDDTAILGSKHDVYHSRNFVDWWHGKGSMETNAGTQTMDIYVSFSDDDYSIAIVSFFTMSEDLSETTVHEILDSFTFY
ncbi:MAG: hypothetical protein ACLTYP_11385 [Eubacterium sp.]|uniref:hypothetical protein n=1 Tax=Eubacterium sp. TaxID=142586 RepID=UPI003994CEB7